jgi:hypothetical protein
MTGTSLASARPTTITRRLTTALLAIVGAVATGETDAEPNLSDEPCLAASQSSG